MKTCCERNTCRNDEEKKKLINRLKKCEGQIRGIEKMIEEDAYCPDILLQVSAITNALNSFNKQLFEAHMKTCVKEDIQEGKLDTLEELTAVVQKLMR